MSVIGTWRPREIHFGRVMVFVDGPNLYRGLLKSFQTDINNIDLAAMINGLVMPDRRSLVRTHFYDSRVTSKSASTSKEPNLSPEGRRQLQATIRHMSYFELHLPDVDHEQRAISEEVDLRLAVDMVSHCARNAYDVAILVSSDVDFVPAIRCVKSFGKQVELVYIPDRCEARLFESCDMRREISTSTLKAHERPRS